MINFKKPKKDRLPQPKKSVENSVYCHFVSAEKLKNMTSEADYKILRGYEGGK